MQALQVLYHGENSDGKEKASLWLGELQKSTFAWQIADQLLLLNYSVESCYFAAQTMRSKIQFFFHELPTSSHESLKSSILNHCTKITLETPQVIVTQLCLALADLCLQLSSWDNPVLDLINRFGILEANWTFLLEVLSLIPEEMGCRSLRLGQERVKEMMTKLKMASPLLIQFLSSVVAAKKDNERFLKQVIHSLSSWIKTSSVPCQLVISNNLLQLPFSVLKNDSSPIFLHKAACDCICNGLLCLESDEVVAEEKENLSQVLFEGVCALSPTFIKLCQTSPDDVERLMNFSRIFTDTCEAFLPYFLSSPNKGFGTFHLLDLVLLSANSKSFEVASLSFTFWNRFAELLYEKQELKDLLSPYIYRLVMALRSHMLLDPSYETIHDCPDDFMEFRYECQELIADVVFMINSEHLFGEMFESLKHCGDSWPECEVCIFIMSASAKDLTGSDTEVVGKVLETILNAGDMHQCVRHSCIKLIKELKNWIDKHPQFIEPCLRFLLIGLQSNHLAGAASDSIENLCLCSPSHMTPLFDNLLQILQSIETSNVSNDAVLGILKGCAGILGRMSVVDVEVKTKQLCALQLVPLSSILNGNAKVLPGSKENDPTIWLDRLAAIFSHLNPDVKNSDVHPCQEAVEQVWPVLAKVFSKCARDGKIIERCCRCIRFAVRCLGKNSTSFVQPIITEIINLFQQYPHSCCLYLGSILVDEFGEDASYHLVLIEMLESLCPLTFKLLDEASGLRNHPDIVDDLFRLAFRFVQRAPQPFVRSSCTKQLLAYATLSCCLDHKDANESSCLFLIEIIKACNTLQGNECGIQMKELLLNQGQEIMNHIIKASLFCLPNITTYKIVELLYELVIFDSEVASHWLRQTLKALPIHSTTGKQTVTEQQIAEFHQIISSSDELKQVSRALQQLTRFFR